MTAGAMAVTFRYGTGMSRFNPLPGYQGLKIQGITAACSTLCRSLRGARLAIDLAYWEAALSRELG